MQTSYTYEAFGGTSQTGSANTNSYKYTGREDDGTGLYYYRARYYSTRLQRFISEDPIGLRGGMNLYAYVTGNPVSHVDPTGHGAVSFAVCTVANMASLVYDAYKDSKIVDDTGMSRDMVQRIDKEIENCPADDVERLVGLKNIRDQLVKGALPLLSDYTGDYTHSSLYEGAKTILWEGGCMLAGAMLPF